MGITGAFLHLFRIVLMALILLIALRRRDTMLGKVVLSLVGLFSILGVYFIFFFLL